MTEKQVTMIKEGTNFVVSTSAGALVVGILQGFIAISPDLGKLERLLCKIGAYGIGFYVERKMEKEVNDMFDETDKLIQATKDAIAVAKAKKGMYVVNEQQ